VQSIADSTRRVIGGPGALHLSPIFFPDGRRLAYWRAENRDCAIVEHDLATGSERTLLDCELRPRARLRRIAGWPLDRICRHPAAAVSVGLHLLEIETGRSRAAHHAGARDGGRPQPRASAPTAGASRFFSRQRFA
jgi:hypothetical protein